MDKSHYQEKKQRPTATKGATKSLDSPRIPHYRDGKKTVVMTPKKGTAFDTCATINEKFICCNVKVLKAVSNCPFDCSYCFLQDYLTNGTTSVVKDTESLMAEVHAKLQSQPWRFFRIGTWELGDSLALEYETGQAKALIQAFSGLKNAVLELKTKSDCVDTILDLDHQSKTVISWSLNTAHIVNKEEHKTASLEKRLIAMKKCVEAGYLIGLHFDPMIYYPDWESGYTELIDAVFEIVPKSQIAWISIGSLRFNPEQKSLMQIHFPGSKLTAEEMVKGDDGKLRYVKPLRLKMYQHLYDLLLKHGAETTHIYFCMERWDVWDTVMGYHPNSIGELDYLFAKSFYTRFPNLGVTEPILDFYENFQDS